MSASKLGPDGVTALWGGLTSRALEVPDTERDTFLAAAERLELARLGRCMAQLPNLERWVLQAWLNLEQAPWCYAELADRLGWPPERLVALAQQAAARLRADYLAEASA